MIMSNIHSNEIVLPASMHAATLESLPARLRRAATGLYTYAEFAACALAWLPVLAGTSVVHMHDDVPRIQGRSLRLFARVASALTPLWRFTIEGAPPPDIASRP